MSDQPSGPVHPSDRGADGPDPFSREGAAASGSGDQRADGPQPGPGRPDDDGPSTPEGSEHPLYPPIPPYQSTPPHQPAPFRPPPWAEQPPAGPDAYGQGVGYGAPGQQGVPATYGQPGGYGTPYGAGYGPTDHPQAVPALVTGIIGLVLSLFCGVGGLVGIAGIVQGRRAKREIDGDPARWTGRSKANAGLVTGVVGLAVLGLWALFFVIAGVAGG